MYPATTTTLLTMSLVSTLVMAAACLAVGLVASKSAARHPVAVADVLGRSGRVRMSIIGTVAIGIVIAWLAELGQSHQSQEDAS